MSHTQSDRAEQLFPLPLDAGSQALLAGRYKPLSVLSAGRRALVLKAQDLQAERLVALKLYRRPRHAAAGEPGPAPKPLEHPGIVALLDSGDLPEGAYVVHELVSSPTLEEVMSRRGALGAKHALTVTRQLTEALAYAHERGVHHLALKPSNVYITRSGARLGDFSQGAASTGYGPGIEGRLLPLGPYMAPEVALFRNSSARSDVWSLGVLLAEMAGGEHPLGSESSAGFLKRLLAGRPRLPKLAEPEFDAIVRPAVMAALQRNPRRRPRDAAAFARLLTPGGARRAVWFPRLARVGVATAAAAGLAWGGLKLASLTRPEPPVTSGVPLMDTAASLAAQGRSRQARDLYQMVVDGEVTASPAERAQAGRLMALLPDDERGSQPEEPVVAEPQPAEPSGEPTPVSERLAALWQAGEQALAATDYERALSQFRALKAAAPRHPGIDKKLAEAERAYRSSEANRLRARGTLLIAEGRFAEARQDFERVLTLRPDDELTRARLRDLDALTRRADEPFETASPGLVVEAAGEPEATLGQPAPIALTATPEPGASAPEPPGPVATAPEGARAGQPLASAQPSPPAPLPTPAAMPVAKGLLGADLLEPEEALLPQADRDPPAATERPVAISAGPPASSPAPAPRTVATPKPKRAATDVTLARAEPPTPQPTVVTAGVAPVSAPPSQQSGMVAAARKRFKRRQYMAAADILSRALADDAGSASGRFAGDVFFNASLQAARGGKCQRARQLANRAAGYDDPERALSNSAWRAKLNAVSDCRDASLQLALRDIAFKR